MSIVDVFEYGGKKAIYLNTENFKIPNEISELIADEKSYQVEKYDITHSIVGKKSIIVLVDTKDNFEIGTNVFLK